MNLAPRPEDAECLLTRWIDLAFVMLGRAVQAEDDLAELEVRYRQMEHEVEMQRQEAGRQ